VKRKIITVCLIAFLLAGCANQRTPPSITLATTTSMQDSGLLDVLVPLFREESGIEVKVVAVGTGQALELARRGDADVVIAHDPESEEKFMAEGHGESRRPIMYNDFVLVGPANDPTKVRGEKSIVAAFEKIAKAKSTFISRGDESGTHLREKAIWKRADIEPKGDGWYVEAGVGMGAVLRMAGEKRACTLSDCGTYLAQGKAIGLEVMCEGDPLLMNQYSVTVVSPVKHPGVRVEGARKFADFLLSSRTQDVVADFGKAKHGRSLFIPGVPEKTTP
jgi:tungstate transport system substrate-binding protein